MQGEVVGILVAGVDASLNYSVPVSVFNTRVFSVQLAFDLLNLEVPQTKALSTSEGPDTPQEPQQPKVPDDPNYYES
jgi:hypothetical protein